MKIFFFLIFMINIVLSSTSLKNPEENLETEKSSLDLQSKNRKLTEIESKTLNATILKNDYLDEIINFGTGEEKDNTFTDWRAEIFSEEKINVHLEEEIIFEIDIKQEEDKTIIEISNTDEEKFKNHKTTHCFFSRQLKRKESLEDLKSFLNLAFENISKILQKKENTIQNLFKDHLLPYLSDRGYSVSLEKRILESQKNSIVLDIYSNDKKRRYFQVLIYSVNKILFGIDIVSILKTYQIRLGKENLLNNFKTIQDNLNKVILEEDSLDEEKAIIEFGAEFTVKTKEVVDIINDFCGGIDVEENLEVKEGNISVIDLTQLEEEACSLAKNKLYIGQVNSLYLQYFYLKTDNEYFTVDYMLGFTLKNIKNMLPNVLKEIETEIEEIKKLKLEEKEEPEIIDIQKILDSILETAQEKEFQIDCGEGVKDEKIECLHGDKILIKAYSVILEGNEFFKIKLMNKDEEKKGILNVVDNELKIPKEDKIGLLNRMKDVLENYMDGGKVKI